MIIQFFLQNFCFNLEKLFNIFSCCNSVFLKMPNLSLKQVPLYFSHLELKWGGEAHRILDFLSHMYNTIMLSPQPYNTCT